MRQNSPYSRQRVRVKLLGALDEDALATKVRKEARKVARVQAVVEEHAHQVRLGWALGCACYHPIQAGCKLVVRRTLLGRSVLVHAHVVCGVEAIARIAQDCHKPCARPELLPHHRDALIGQDEVVGRCVKGDGRRRGSASLDLRARKQPTVPAEIDAGLDPT